MAATFPLPSKKIRSDFQSHSKYTTYHSHRNRQFQRFLEASKLEKNQLPTTGNKFRDELGQYLMEIMRTEGNFQRFPNFTELLAFIQRVVKKVSFYEDYRAALPESIKPRIVLLLNKHFEKELTEEERALEETGMTNKLLHLIYPPQRPNKEEDEKIELPDFIPPKNMNIVYRAPIHNNPADPLDLDSILPDSQGPSTSTPQMMTSSSSSAASKFDQQMGKSKNDGNEGGANAEQYEREEGELVSDDDEI